MIFLIYYFTLTVTNFYKILNFLIFLDFGFGLFGLLCQFLYQYEPNNSDFEVKDISW